MWIIVAGLEVVESVLFCSDGLLMVVLLFNCCCAGR